MAREQTATPIVLAMNDRMQCHGGGAPWWGGLQGHAYGPFSTERDAELWAKAQNDDPAQREYQYVVIGMLPARVTISRAVMG